MFYSLITVILGHLNMQTLYLSSRVKFLCVGKIIKFASETDEIIKQINKPDEMPETGV